MFPALSTAVASFLFHEFFTHPKRLLRKKLPVLRIWRLEFFPCVRFHGRSRTLHIHHWIYLSIVLVISIPLDFTFLDSSITRSFLAGGALQGFLINKKARRVIYSNPLEISDEYR